MSRTLLRSKAKVDIAEIWAHIAEDSEVHADAYLDRLDAQIQMLALRPALGRQRPELGPAIRSFPLGRYVIYYQKTSGGISVVRVLHSARDVAPLLKPSG